MPEWTLPVNAGVFALATVVIVVCGTRLSAVADLLADRTRWGEALAGAVLLGGTTSLSGTVVSISAAAQGDASLAISNAIGGIAVQTAFLPVADAFYRRANLEHAAASLPNVMSGVLVMGLLGLVLLAAAGPSWSVWGVHPVTPLIVAGYLSGIHLTQQARQAPMWEPHRTPDTREDKPDPAADEVSLGALWMRFAGLAAVMGVAGWVVMHTGTGIARQSGLGSSVVGTLLTAVATSTPELVTAIAAVRRGALTLAVAGVLGGNAFDVLFTVGADVAYREGSVYHAITVQERFVTALALAMTAVLVLGLLRRQRRGPGRIGFEGVLVLAMYLGGAAVVATR